MSGPRTRRQFLERAGTAGLAGFALPGQGQRYGDFGATDLTQAKPTKEWERRYGSDGHEIAEEIIRTSDGEYLFCGTTEFQYGTGKAWLVKLAADGSKRWDQTFSEGTEANAVAETPDGGYVFAGNTTVDSEQRAWVVRVDSDGTEQWSESYPGNGPSRARALVVRQGSGYAFAGATESDGNEDAWLVSVDEEGAVKWERTYGGDGDDWANDLIRTSDGHFLLAGRKSADGAQDAYLVKVSRDGTKAWEQTYGGTGGDDGAGSVIETTQSEYVFSGKTIKGGSYDGWLVKVAPDGTERAVWTFGTDMDDTAEAVVEAADGGFVFEGATEVEEGGIEDLWIGKVSADGTVEWTATYGTPNDDYSLSFTPTHDGGFLLLGNSQSFGTYSAWLVKLQTDSVDVVTRTVTATPTPTATRSPTRTASQTVSPTATNIPPTDQADSLTSASATADGTRASTPGFGFVSSLLALGGLGYLGWRRHRESGD